MSRYVAKLYNVLAGEIARDLVRTLSDVQGAECLLVSRIGARIDEPQAVCVQLRSAGAALSPACAASAEAIVRDHLDRVAALSDLLVAGQARLY